MPSLGRAGGSAGHRWHRAARGGQTPRPLGVQVYKYSGTEVSRYKGIKRQIEVQSGARCGSQTPLPLGIQV